MDAQATRDSVLNAAELLFGDHGFPSASLRQITDKAGVNLAAVNYHFRSKEDLYRQVLFRRLRPVNAERLTLLTQAEQLAGDQPVPLRAVLETFIRPLLRRADDPASGGIPFLRLLSRDLLDPQPFLSEELVREFEPLMTRYTHAFSQALPGLPPLELFWRTQFALGAQLYVAARQHDFDRRSRSFGPTDSGEGCIRRLVDFCAAGLGSPPLTAA